MERGRLSETEPLEQSLKLGEELLVLFFMVLSNTESHGQGEAFGPLGKIFFATPSWTEFHRPCCLGFEFQTLPKIRRDPYRVPVATMAE